MPVVITTPPPRLGPSAVTSARRAAQRAWSARLALLQHARTALPRAKAWGSQASRWLPRAQALSVRAKALGVRLALPAKRTLPKATRWARRTLRSAPRSVLVAAPLSALLVLWLVHGMASRGAHGTYGRESGALGAVPASPVAASPARAEPQPFTAAISAPTATARALADDAELRLALTQGLPAMEALAARYSGDPQVLVSLASAEAQAQRYDSAVLSVDRALAAAPSNAQNGKIMGILWRAAQSSAAEESFACLRKLGARGADVEFDLATTPGVRDAVRARAKAELSKFMAFDASPDTRAAAALLLAPDCPARKALLERAERDGARRTLAMLQRFAHGAGCSSSSDGACNTCLTGSPALTQAIAKLSAGARP